MKLIKSTKFGVLPSVKVIFTFELGEFCEVRYDGLLYKSFFGTYLMNDSTNRPRPNIERAFTSTGSSTEKGKMSLEDIVHLANKVGMEYAKAKKNAEYLELLKATNRAKAMLKYDDGKMSEAKIKRLAETDEAYVEFLVDLSAAKSEAEKLRIRYESYKNLFEARRSMLSYQKAEMKLL